MQPGVDELDAGLHARPGPVVGDGADDPAEPQRPDGPELVLHDPLPRRLQSALLLRHVAGRPEKASLLSESS